MDPIEIRLDDEGWRKFRQSVERDGGALVEVSREPALFEQLKIRVVVNGGPLVELVGQVVHYSPRGEAALTFDEAARTELERAGRRLVARASTQMDEEPIWARYQAMSKPERMRLARSGNELERRAVLKDRDVSLHLQVLNNPQLTAKEVAQLIRGGGVSAAFIQKVTERRELMGNPMVVEALVVNPLTPVDIAVRLVERIPLEVARRIARSGNYKPQVVAACRKRVTS